MSLLTVSGSPHVHSDNSTKRIMWTVVAALLPAFLMSVYFFGISALWVTLVSVAACLLFEWLIQKIIFKRPSTITDGSAAITGMLLAFNLPSSISLGWVVIGALVAIGVGKMTFGGLGKNPFNPALVGRVFLFLSAPTQVAISEWPLPKALFGCSGSVDAVVGPTPLALVKMQVKGNASVVDRIPGYWDLFIGSVGGSLGEVSALALIIGGIILLARKVISWHIPVAFIGAACIFSGIFWCIDSTTYADPLTHILSGGIMLGAIFMATDYVTSPMADSGKLIFGASCGVLAIIFRLFGNMPEGVSFAILIMNALTPLIDKKFKPKRFGY